MLERVKFTNSLLVFCINTPKTAWGNLSMTSCFLLDARADQNSDEWVKALGLKKSKRTDILKKKNAERQNNKRSPKLIKKKFPLDGGLHDPPLSQISLDRCTSEGVQIHNTGKIHWITSSSIGGQPVSVYDSLYDDITESSEKRLKLHRPCRPAAH